MERVVDCIAIDFVSHWRLRQAGLVFVCATSWAAEREKAKSRKNDFARINNAIVDVSLGAMFVSDAGRVATHSCTSSYVDTGEC